MTAKRLHRDEMATKRKIGQLVETIPSEVLEEETMLKIRKLKRRGEVSGLRKKKAATMMRLTRKTKTVSRL